MTRMTKGEKAFQVFDVLFLALITLSCLIPLLYVLANSFSEKDAVDSKLVTLLPVGFNTANYEFVLRRVAFWKSFLVSIKRVVLGVPLNLYLMITVAFVLNHDNTKLSGRTAYTWFFVFTMLFGGGLIPSYLLVKELGLIDSIWALILPGCVPIYNTILMLNFFRQLPNELEDAAIIDGAGYLRVLWRIIVPVSTPSIATMVLFQTVGHWNGWLEGILFMNKMEDYPLQSYLRSVLVTNNAMETGSFNATDAKIWETISEDGSRCAQIIIAMIPILSVYPFLQRYFVKGITLGSVKG